MAESLPPLKNEAERPNPGADDVPKADVETPNGVLKGCAKAPVEVPPNAELPDEEPKGLELPKGRLWEPRGVVTEDSPKAADRDEYRLIKTLNLRNNEKI